MPHSGALPRSTIIPIRKPCLFGSAHKVHSLTFCRRFLSVVEMQQFLEERSSPATQHTHTHTYTHFVGPPCGTVQSALRDHILSHTNCVRAEVTDDVSFRAAKRHPRAPRSRSPCEFCAVFGFITSGGLTFHHLGSFLTPMTQISQMAEQRPIRSISEAWS